MRAYLGFMGKQLRKPTLFVEKVLQEILEEPSKNSQTSKKSADLTLKNLNPQEHYRYSSSLTLTIELSRLLFRYRSDLCATCLSTCTSTLDIRCPCDETNQLQDRLLREQDATKTSC